MQGVYFGPLVGGMGAHSPDIFGMWEILVTRKKSIFSEISEFFPRKWAKVQMPKFYP